MSGKSPTSLSLARLRDLGYCAQVVERWNPHARVRQDLFGCIDLVAIHADERGVLGVQATSEHNSAARRRKIDEIEEARTWVAAGNQLEVWGWAKKRFARRTLQVLVRWKLCWNGKWTTLN